ncbi:MAG: hypothetical protein H6706_00655 [Myxococcales bacterium]|nr:hypothetical protein [Myxococcales bacterium]
MRALCLLLSLGPAAAHAACGLDACEAPRAAASAPAWLGLATGVRALGLAAGTLYEPTLRVTVLPVAGLAVGAEARGLGLPADHRYGLGNAVLFADAHHAVGATTLLAGLQVELPTGAADLVDDHAELLGHVGAVQPVGGLRLGGRLGYRHALGAHHHHHADDAPVVPGHGARELVYRLGAGLPVGRLEPGLDLDGQHVLDADAHERAFLSALARLDARLTPDATLRVAARAPLTTARRQDWLGEAALTLWW